MKLDYATGGGIPQDKLEQRAATLEPYRVQLKSVAKQTDYQAPEASLQLPQDTRLLHDVRSVVEQIRTATLQYVVVIGIGGSNLGTRAVYEAVAGSMNLLIDRLPKLLFLDTVSDERMTAITRELINTHAKEDFAIIVISKSGTTTETVANTETLWKELKEHFGDVHERFLVITDEGSKLWRAAEQRSVHRIAIPEQVGGRYSVFSAVGLVPLLLGKIDIDELLSGAQQALNDGLSDNLAQNPALVSACLTHLHLDEGRPIHNGFFFSPKLESLGKWYRQLMGESLGKSHDVDGNKIHAGITPIVSIGSTDLHSMAQLYFAGPDDKFTNLIYSFKGDVNDVPAHMELPGLVDHLKRKSLEDIMEAIVGGVSEAYQHTKRPYLSIDLEGATPWELGYYLQFRMIEMMYLAKLMNLNAFDQPAVELYKTGTRERLATSKKPA